MCPHEATHNIDVADQSSGMEYHHRPYPLLADRRYSLESEAIVWTSKLGHGQIRYADVVRINVFKTRFLGSSATYWSSKLVSRSGETLRLSASSRPNFWRVDDLTSTYIPFIKELERRVAVANPTVRPISGRHWLARAEHTAGATLVRCLRLLRNFDLQKTSNTAGWIMRHIGPRLRGHATAKVQLAAAFPEKSTAEINMILQGMWDNLARVVVEYAHLDRLWRYDAQNLSDNSIVMDDETRQRTIRLQNSRRPALMFSAHLANWELPAHAATAGGRNIAVVFRAPNIGPINEELRRMRNMQVAALYAADHTTPFRIKDALRRGWMVGMLVDQHYASGIEVCFFGRRCKVNPLLARFARLTDCDVHGSRMVRLPDGRFQFEVTEAIALPRDKDGRVDVTSTMQMVTSMIEVWIREHPQQWLWFQRHWR